MKLFFQIQSSSYWNSVCIIRNLLPIWVMFFMFFCFFLEHHQSSSCLYCFITLLHLVSSFSLTRPLLFPDAYVCIVDCIILSSFELKVIFLISSVKTLCLSLLNVCCVLNINLLFFMNSLWSSSKLSIPVSFFLDSLFYFQVEFLLNSFHNRLI